MDNGWFVTVQALEAIHDLSTPALNNFELWFFDLMQVAKSVANVPAETAPTENLCDEDHFTLLTIDP
jgi:hypothetical protein